MDPGGSASTNTVSFCIIQYQSELIAVQDLLLTKGKNMRQINNKKEFEKLFTESQALVCDFSASWCGPCKSLEPVLKKLEKDNQDIVFVQIDVNKQRELSDKYRIQAMPTVLFVKKGKEIKRIVGFKDYEALSKHAKKLLDAEASL